MPPTSFGHYRIESELGRGGMGVVYLKKAAANGFPDYPLFRGDPHFKTLQEYPPFQRLMTALRRACLKFRSEFGAVSVN